MAERVAIYCRVSTAGQELGRQRAELEAFAAARGWEVVLVAEDVASGAKASRPGRDQVLHLARTRRVDIVLVQALDRWARSVLDLVASLQELEALRVPFVVPGLLDMTTPAGRAVAGFLGVVAEFERDLIRARVRSGIAHARAQGRPHGRPRSNPDTVAKAVSLVLQGASTRTAAGETGLSRGTVQRAVQAARKGVAHG